MIGLRVLHFILVSKVNNGVLVSQLWLLVILHDASADQKVTLPVRTLNLRDVKLSFQLVIQFRFGRHQVVRHLDDWVVVAEGSWVAVTAQLLGNEHLLTLLQLEDKLGLDQLNS